MKLHLSSLRAAAQEEIQRHEGAHDKPFRVTIVDLHGNRLNYEYERRPADLDREDQGMPPMGEKINGTPKRLEFSPTEAAIIAVLTKEWQTKQEISDSCKLPLSSQFCSLLTNLVDRLYLESGHKGYRLL